MITITTYINCNNYLEIRGDSKPILNQLQGLNKISNDFLKDQYISIRKYLQFGTVRYSHYKRKYNATADYLANIAMDSKTSKSNREFTQVQMDTIRSYIQSDIRG